MYIYMFGSISCLYLTKNGNKNVEFENDGNVLKFTLLKDKRRLILSINLLFVSENRQLNSE
jgi:hypothetical protein